MPNDTVIVSSWEQFVNALAGGASYIKWADAAVKQINVANISSKLICRCNEVDFNGWTIETLNIYGVDDYYAFYREDYEYGYGHYGIFRAINLTVNHFNVFNTAKACIIVFGILVNCYFNDIYYEAHETPYQDEAPAYSFAYGASAQICGMAYNSKLCMRSEDYAPRVPTLWAQNCEIKIDYKWTKTGADTTCLLMGKKHEWSSPYEVAHYYNCYIYGKIDLSEGTGEWQWSSPETTYVGYVDTQDTIFNIETTISEDCTFDRVCINAASGSSGSTWADIEGKSLFVTNNGNARTRYEAILSSTRTIYIDGVPANLVRTLKENLKNKDWLNDIYFNFIDDDLFRYPQYVTTPDTSTEWVWRKSNYVNNSVPFLPFWDYPAIQPPVYHGDVYESEYITIYDMKTEQDGFDGHGLAVLRPYSCRIVEELNGAYNLTLTHPKDAEGRWQYILEMNIIQALGQLFVIQKVDEVISGNSYYVAAYAEHISYTLNDRWIFPPVTIAGYHGATLIESIIEQSTDMGGDWQTNYTFTVDSDIDAPNDFQDWYEMPDGVTPYEMLVGSNGFVAKLGGELYRDNFTMKINKRMYDAQDNAFELAIGYNLTGVKRTVDLTTFCTYFRAYDVSDGYYETWFAISYDPASLPRAYPRNVVRSANFTYDHEDYKEGQLERDGFAFWNQNCAPVISYELSVKDLRRVPEYKYFTNHYRFKVGDKGRVWDERLQAWTEVEITRTEKDGITGDTTKVIIGSQRSFTRPNNYNPITPTQIDADKFIEGYPPIDFMSDGGNLRHMLIYGAAGGVGDTINYDTGTVEEKHYDLFTGEPDSVLGYYSTVDTIKVEAGFPYTITCATESTIYALYYGANGDYISDDASTYGTSFDIITPAGTRYVRLMAEPVDGETVIDSFGLTGIGIIVKLVNPEEEEKVTVIPLASPLVDGQSLDLSTAGVNVPTWSGENTLVITTTVTPRVKIQYKEPIQRDINRTIEDEPPIQYNADGNNLDNWIIWGNTGGVGTVSANLFDSTLSNDYYNNNGIKDGTNDNYISSDVVIPVEPNTEYSVSIYTDTTEKCSNVSITIFQYRENGNMFQRNIGRITQVTSTYASNYKYTFTTTAVTASVRFMINITNFKEYLNLNTVHDLMFYLGSVKKPYEPAGGIPVIITNGTDTKRVNIPVTAPLEKGQTLSKQTTGIDIPTFAGANTLTIDTTVQPEKVKIQYKEPL